MQADIDYQQNSRPGGLAESLFLRLAARIECGELDITLPSGAQHQFKGRQPGPRAAIQIHHPRVFRQILLGGTMAFAEAYMRRDCDCSDLTALVELMIRNDEAVMQTLDERRWYHALQRIGHLLRPNSRRGARRNIARHYDLGNDFYALWLDPSMTYSSAVFERSGEALDEAQRNKYRRIAELIGIGPDHRVLEVGCGWGGFASWAAREIGCRLTPITISRAQHDFAADRFQKEGVGETIDLRLQDYRDVEGQFDRIVSIEMFEAVGEEYWPRYFAMLQDRLKPGGRAGLQVITIDDALYETYRRGVDFIQRYIFPGGLLPSLERLRDQVRNAGLTWDGSNAYGAHYARTLEIWRHAFEGAWPQIQALGFDERFRRMWRYYLAYCEAGFSTGRIDVLQTSLAKP